MKISPEDAAAYITAVGVLGTAANIVISLAIRNAILSIKNWAKDEFIAKRDVGLYLGPFRQGIQHDESSERLRAL